MKNNIKSFILAAAFALCGQSVANAVQPVVSIDLISGGVGMIGTYAITNTPSNPLSPLRLSWTSLQFDSSAFTQARVIVVLGQTTLPNATTSFFVRYQPNIWPTFLDNTFADYFEAGAGSTEVSVAMSTTQQTICTGPWTTLDAGAIGDCVWVIGAVDTANAGLKPYINRVEIQFR